MKNKKQKPSPKVTNTATERAAFITGKFILWAAIIGGVCAVASTVVTLWFNKQERTNLRREKLEFRVNSFSEYTNFESQHKALLLSLEAQADSYAKLLKSTILTEKQREECEESYERAKAELEKQKLLADQTTNRRIQAEKALEKQRKSELDFDELKVEDEKLLQEKQHNLLESEPLLHSFWKTYTHRTYRIVLPYYQIKKIIDQYDFYCSEFELTKSYCNPQGKGVENKFEQLSYSRVIFDAQTDLYWQQSGSSERITFNYAQKYIEKLNTESYGGYNNWRLPTFEEAMTLIEPEKKKNDLHIDLVFDKTQRWIWTADHSPPGHAWVVAFSNGSCYTATGHSMIHARCHVRAVRSRPRNTQTPQRVFITNF